MPDFDEDDDRGFMKVASAGFWLGLQADVHRRVVFMPQHENGRRVLPALIEMPILRYLDTEGEDIVEDLNMDEAAYAVCVTNSDDREHEVVVDLSFKGVTVH
jgi:hypothetical protein